MDEVMELSRDFWRELVKSRKQYDELTDMEKIAWEMVTRLHKMEADKVFNG